MDVQTARQHRYKIAGLGVPILLALNIVLGGSVRGMAIATAALEVIACFVLVWCLFDSRLRPLGRSAFWLLGIVGFSILVCVLQLVPLPYAWWTDLPGRAAVSEAFAIAGLGQVDQPMSLAPEETLYGLLRFLPPVAMFVLVCRLPWTTLTANLPWTVVLLAVFSATLGLAQTFIKDLPQLFFYGREQAAGLFQIVNHQATLQLMAIPFVAVLFERLKSQVDLGDAYQAHAIMAVTALVLVVVGVVLSGSVAGYAMLIPVMAASCLLVMEGKPSPQLVAIGLAVGAGLCGLTFVVLTSPMLSGLGATDMGDGPLSRRDIYRGALEMTRDNFPWGAGLGAFEGAYPAYETPSTVTASYITHAHSDYLEIAAELGAPGSIALAAAIIWSLVMTVQAWRATLEEGGGLRRAAGVAVAVVLIHSLVDSPARTEAISCLAALCMGVMASGPDGRRPDRSSQNRQREAFMHRHVEI